MGFQDRDYVKEKHKALEQETTKQKASSFKKKVNWTYLGGFLLILAAMIREIFFR